MIFSRRKKYIAVFCIRELEVNNILGTRKINPTSKTIRFRRHTFIIDVSTPSYIKNNKVFYFLSLTTKKQLTFDDSKEVDMNTELIDSVISQNIVEQLTKNLNDNLKMNIIQILLGLCAGILIGYFYAQYTLTPTTSP